MLRREPEALRARIVNFAEVAATVVDRAQRVLAVSPVEVRAGHDRRPLGTIEQCPCSLDAVGGGLVERGVKRAVGAAVVAKGWSQYLVNAVGGGAGAEVGGSATV